MAPHHVVFTFRTIPRRVLLPRSNQLRYHLHLLLLMMPLLCRRHPHQIFYLIYELLQQSLHHRNNSSPGMPQSPLFLFRILLNLGLEDCTRLSSQEVGLFDCFVLSVLICCCALNPFSIALCMLSNLSLKASVNSF